MGQIFYACAYDTETRTCCMMNVDKFHANCHAESGAVLSIHYIKVERAEKKVIYSRADRWVYDGLYG